MKKTIEKFEMKKLSLKTLNSVLGSGSSSTGETSTNTAGDYDIDQGGNGLAADSDVPPRPIQPTEPTKPGFELGA